MNDPMAMLVGVVLVVVGAVGATVTQRRLEEEGRGRRVPLMLVPFGVLIGAGAAIARGWELPGAMAAGAVLVPLVAVVGRWWEVRRRRRARSRQD